MRSYEFYFSDLNVDAQIRYLEFLDATDAKEANMDMDLIPIFELCVDDSVQVVQEEFFPEDAAVYDDKDRT